MNFFLLKNRIIVFCLIGLITFFSCEEAAIPVKDDGIPMKLDTISFPVIKAMSYQVPPEMGRTDLLYFGNKDGYNFSYNLIKLDSSSVTAGTPFSFYNDSLIIVDSLKFSLRFDSDSIENNPEFQLRYFPDGGDSVFNELESNYINFDKSIASTFISTGQLESDTTDTNQTKVFLNFLLDSSIVNAFKDTNITDFNRSFLVELKNEESESFVFHSSDKVGADGPQLKVYYRQFVSDSVVLDTTFRTYAAIEDLSIIIPPPISTDDSSYLSVGTAMGLKSIVLVDMVDWILDPRAIISSAELIFNFALDDTLQNYTVISYPIINEGDFLQFSSFDKDPYDEDFNYYTSTSIVEDKLKINHRKIATEIGHQKYNNYGFKLEPSISNDPFRTMLFYSIDSPDYFPVMRVIYVLP
jgi:hypothetical protein|tara:strand:+ start:314 stop:1546 length:1233 start_codon:yes stop_codon:yes gene_type:complete